MNALQIYVLMVVAAKMVLINLFAIAQPAMVVNDVKQTLMNVDPILVSTEVYVLMDLIHIVAFVCLVLQVKIVKLILMIAETIHVEIVDPVLIKLMGTLDAIAM